MKEKRFSPKQLFSSTEAILVHKDLISIWGRKGIRTLIVLVPVILVVILPAVYFAAISLLPETGKDIALLPQALQPFLPQNDSSLTYRQAWIYIFSKLICPLLYLCVPILCAASSASCVFVGEKETDTLETIMLSPMRPRSVFYAKIACCVLLSIGVSLVAFVAFGVTMSVGGLLTGAPFFFNVEWLILLFLLTPGASFLSAVFISAIINRVYSSAEALQTIGYLILPFAVLYLVQLSGLFHIGPVFLLILTVLLVVIAVILLRVSVRGFEPEKLFEQKGAEWNEN